MTDFISRFVSPRESRLQRLGGPRAIGLVFTLFGFVASVHCQPRLIVEEPQGYRVGERISEEAFVLDKEMVPHRIRDLIKPDVRVAVMVIFGGDFKTAPEEEKFRGPLWCEDSFDDLAVQRALVHAFKDRPVQFIAVAVPPVYHAKRFGWTDDVFLSRPDDSPEYREAAQTFIEATEREVRNGLLPFEEVYYDPKFRLAQNRKERELGPEFGPVYEWQGKLKWAEDGRKYGTPTIWLLGRDGEILTEPLFGNDYDADPPEVNYGYQDARELIERLLGDGS